MSHCKWIGECRFFTDPVGYSPEMAELVRARYCHDDYHSCARYIARLLEDFRGIPDTMMPSDHQALEEVIVRLCPVNVLPEPTPESDE